MKDQVQSCHLTKFDAFGVNRDEVIDLETWFKIHTNVCNLETASPKTIRFYRAKAPPAKKNVGLWGREWV